MRHLTPSALEPRQPPTRVLEWRAAGTAIGRVFGVPCDLRRPSSAAVGATSGRDSRRSVGPCLIESVLPVSRFISMIPCLWSVAPAPSNGAPTSLELGPPAQRRAASAFQAGRRGFESRLPLQISFHGAIQLPSVVFFPSSRHP